MMKHSKSYHQNSAILFQFIYSECLSSHRELIALTTKQNLSFEKTVPILIQLTGPGNTSFQFFSWGTQNGIITKLKNNCAHFARVSAIQNRALLHSHADKAWLLCLECYHPYAILSEPLSKAFQHIQHLADELKEMIVNFKDDENVLFFLLQHQRQLETMHHKDFVKEKIHQLFPDGTALEFLINRYQERGFSHLIPQISTLIAEL